ncbi:MAG: hypothetical protein H7202_06455 [Pedobacter sp.]|nr:hypothetical protein [Pedobacter sp.]
MKKILYTSLVLLSAAFVWAGCKDTNYLDGLGNYEGGTISPFIPIYDLRDLYKGEDLVLSKENMYGSSSISGVVISDHKGKNLPTGWLIIQDKRRLNELRGITIQISAVEAEKYVSGDSVHINIEGGKLSKVDGMLEILNVSPGQISKKASNVVIPPNRVPSSFILANPTKYESTLVALVKAGFDPVPEAKSTYLGDKTLNDGFGNFTLHTEATATFANTSGLNFLANYYGIVINKAGTNGKLITHSRIRTLADVIALSSTPEIASVVISGYMADLEGADGNYEYMQFLATKNIDFAVTPYAVVVTNNAGSSTPTGIFPTKGWATGIDALATPVGLTARTYKLNLTSGIVKKGEFFYVGGTNKLINGPSSTSIASANWVKSKNYTTATPANAPAGNGDGFGLYTGGLFANSGNASGFAIFEGINVDVNSVPIDCIFIGTGGSIYSASSLAGYKIANTDFYDKVDPITLTPQAYFLSGTNKLSFAYQLPSDQGFWNKLSGVYDATLGRWVKARTQNNLDLSKTSPLTDIEDFHLKQILDGSGNVLKTDTIMPTRIK